MFALQANIFDTSYHVDVFVLAVYRYDFHPVVVAMGVEVAEVATQDRTRMHHFGPMAMPLAAKRCYLHLKHSTEHQMCPAALAAQSLFAVFYTMTSDCIRIHLQWYNWKCINWLDLGEYDALYALYL